MERVRKHLNLKAYVITLDFTRKMIDIHERYICGLPVVIEGETGVGKTALIGMLSNLWNEALWELWVNEKKEIFAVLERHTKKGTF